MNKTLLLNSSYEPLHAISWRRAVLLIHLGKADLLETDGHEIKTAKGTFPFPCVVRLRGRVPIRIKNIPFNRANVFMRDQYTCQYCGEVRPRNGLTFDHVLPRDKGGQTTWSNIVAACVKCNQDKGNKTVSEAGYSLRSRPRRPANRFWLIYGNRTDVPESWKPYLEGYLRAQHK